MSQASDAVALRRLIAPVGGALRIAVVLRVLAAGASAIPYAAMGLLVKALTARPIDTPEVWFAASLVCGGLGLFGLLLTSALTISHLADARLGGINRHLMVRALARAPLAWFSGTTSGRLRQVLENDVSSVHYLVAHRQVDFAGSLATPLFGSILAFWIDWRLGILALIPSIVGLALMSRMMKYQTEILTELEARQSAISSTVNELVDGITVIKTFGRTGSTHDRFRESVNGYITFFMKWTEPNLRNSAIATAALSAPIVLVVNLVGGLFMVERGWVGVHDVLVTTLISLSLGPAIQVILEAGAGRLAAAQAAGRVGAIIGIEPITPPSPTRAKELTEPRGDVAAEEVTFGYDPHEPVLRSVSAQLVPGTVTALVGPSGSGKSTLATLVARFGDPQGGRLLIDALDLRDLPGRSLYDAVGFVLQGDGLLGVSIHDNIALACPEATRADVKAAAKAAYVDHVIEALPRGYDSVVGDDAQLSGGERQRIAIARVLVHDPQIVILDEATSFADPDSEVDIQRSLARLARGRTVLVIAHRLTTIVSAHRILVMDGGEIVEAGRHQELVEKDGIYSKMWADHCRAHALQEHQS